MIVLKYLAGQFFFLTCKSRAVNTSSRQDCYEVRGLMRNSQKHFSNFHKLKNTRGTRGPRAPRTRAPSIEAHVSAEHRAPRPMCTRTSVKGRAPVAAPTRALAVDARRRLARRTTYATPHATVDGQGARVARYGARSAPRVAHGGRGRARVAGDARLAVDGACRVSRRA